MSDADFIIIGSGPAGVCAALPLAEAGRSVLMLDGAVGHRAHAAVTPSERMLGLDMEGLSIDDGLSPKLRAPEARRAITNFVRGNRVAGENFVVIGSLARGGLSRLWGAFAAEFSPADLEGWPIRHADLTASYARVSRRMGISGTAEDAAGAGFWARPGAAAAAFAAGYRFARWCWNGMAGVRQRISCWARRATRS